MLTYSVDNYYIVYINKMFDYVFDSDRLHKLKMHGSSFKNTTLEA